MNYDRHIDNYGILTEPTTGNIVSMAPNFDNNLALLTNDLPEWKPLMGFLSDYRDLFAEYSVPSVSAQQLTKAIDRAYADSAREFSSGELQKLRTKAEIRDFILQSYSLVKGQELSYFLNMELDNASEHH